MFDIVLLGLLLVAVMSSSLTALCRLSIRVGFIALIVVWPGKMYHNLRATTVTLSTAKGCAGGVDIAWPCF